jgi:RNA polymerase sigma factor (sigma-70 family)
MTQSTSSPSRFAATRWTLIVAANNWRADSSAHRAMSQLAALYWFPLYAYLRRKGHDPAHAEDLVQGFFTRLLEKDALAAADRTKGKFRSFLLASLQNYVTNEWDKSRASKRGGGDKTIPLDALAAEARYAAEPAAELTPERVYERRWALEVLDQVLARLREEYAARNQAALFTALESLLVAGNRAPYATLAIQLHMSEGAVKVAAHRLRKRYRELLREEIAHTVADPALVDDEIRDLLASL